MTTENGAPPPKASALVVGIESYGVAGAGQGLRGSALLAAQFVQWLLGNGVCSPGRITLMANYEASSYQDGTSAASLSPRQLLTDLEAKGINVLPQARADIDFGRWINGPHGPKQDDELFTLFWIGHGFTFPDDPSERLCLLGSDADDTKLENVELTDLLHEVGRVAPAADVVAFVNACRAPAPADWVRRLDRGQQRLSAGQANEPRPRSQSVVYAAAHGETTKMVGNPDTTFAAVLLKRLEVLGDAGPRALFGAGLVELVEDLHKDQVGLYWTRFGYWDPYRKLSLRPPQDSSLKHEEWQNLVKEAEAIDGSHATERRVRWGAFCHASGLDGPDERPERIDSLKDLILALRDLPPRWPTLAPPLVSACDYVAHLPDANAQPGLRQWCEDWASHRGRDGVRRLERARELRPDELPHRPYLSIEVVHVPEAAVRGRRSPKRYRVKPFLWTDNGPDWLTWSDLVPRDEIIAETLYAIGEAVERGDVPYPDDLLVEFVLPRRLLGWWPEYEQELGLQYAIVIRDQERLVCLDGKSAARQAGNKLRLIADHPPHDGAPLSERVAWFTCDEPHEPTTDRIKFAVRRNFCLVLGRKNGYPSADDSDGAPPWELVESVKAGAAIVVSLQQEINCDSRLHALSLASGGEEMKCYMAEGRQLIIRNIDDADSWRALSRDLPYIIRDIREELTWRNRPDLKIGVLMEDPKRLWPGYFELTSGYQPGSN